MDEGDIKSGDRPSLNAPRKYRKGKEELMPLLDINTLLSCKCSRSAGNDRDDDEDDDGACDTLCEVDDGEEEEEGEDVELDRD